MRSFKDLTWLAPFIFLAAIALAPLRPWPVFSPPAESRVITDGQGEKVAIPLPVHVISLDGAVDYLELTHAPEGLFKAGGPRQRAGFAKGMWARFYPQMMQNDRLWDCPGDVESLLAQDNGATYFVWNSTALRRFGLAAVAIAPKRGDDFFTTLLRVENSALNRAEDGEALFADYQQAYADLEQELRPETLNHLPRILPIGSSAKDWSNIWISGIEDTGSEDKRVGVMNASVGFEAKGRQQEAERVLAMNPDIVFTGAVNDFLQDSRWQGLKAVQTKRVYSGPGIESGVPSWHFDFRPLSARWTAEVVHPDRLQPKIRGLIRDHFMKAYGYSFSDDEIDHLLRTFDNKNATDYARFTRNNIAITKQDVLQ